MYALCADGVGKSVRLPTGDTLEILSRATLEVRQGEFVAVTGRSGSGKTTLLAVLGLLAQPDTGSVYLDRVDTSSLSDAARSRLRNSHIGYVFQNSSLLPHLNATQNVALAFLQGDSVPSRLARRRVAECLEAVGLQTRGSARPRELSGGEQQRVAVARALARRPSLLLADEPTGSLDRTTADQVLRLLLDTVRASGTTLVLVTHDEQIAAQADRVLQLERGVLIDRRRRRETDH